MYYFDEKDESVKKKLDNCMVQIYSWAADEHDLHPSPWAHLTLRTRALEYICVILIGMLPTLGLPISFEASAKKGFANWRERPNIQIILLSYPSVPWICTIMDTGVAIKNLPTQITSVTNTRVTSRKVPRVKWRWKRISSSHLSTEVMLQFNTGRLLLDCL